LSYDGGDFGSKKRKLGYGSVWQISELDGRIRVGTLGRNLPSVSVKLFSRLIYLKINVIHFCTFSAISGDSAAIICFPVQHKNVAFHSILTGHTLR
jgi:hypothetical protein